MVFDPNFCLLPLHSVECRSRHLSLCGRCRDPPNITSGVLHDWAFSWTIIRRLHARNNIQHCEYGTCRSFDSGSTICVNDARTCQHLGPACPRSGLVGIHFYFSFCLILFFCSHCSSSPRTAPRPAFWKRIRETAFFEHTALVFTGLGGDGSCLTLDVLLARTRCS